MRLRRGCACLVGASLLLVILWFFLPLGWQGCEWALPDESFEDKSVDFLIAKLDHWRVRYRVRALRYLSYKTDERDRIIAAVTDTLLNDTHEEVRASAARVLAWLTPPATEAVPSLIEALNLSDNDRGKPLPWFADILPLPMAVKGTLKAMGTPEALEAIDEFNRSGPKLVESSIADGASEVDAEFINQHGITLRVPRDNTHNVSTLGHCRILDPDRRTVWRQSFTTVARDTVTTIKPYSDDPKLLNGTVYVLEVECDYRSTPYLIGKITFTTKP